MIVTVAKTFEQRCAAWRVVHDEYVRMGFIEPHPSGMCFSLLDLLPTSTTFIAVKGGQIVGTIGAVLCTSAGLPAGSSFDPDFAALEVDGFLCCECTKLACRTGSTSSAREIPLRLMAAAVVWGRMVGVDSLFGVAHPRHTGPWRGTFGFVESSPSRPVSHVADQPGVLVHCDLRAIFTHRLPMPERGRRLISEVLRKGVPFRYPHRITLEELRFLLELRPELWDTASASVKMAIYRSYPNFRAEPLERAAAAG